LTGMIRLGIIGHRTVRYSSLNHLSSATEHSKNARNALNLSDSPEGIGRERMAGVAEIVAARRARLDGADRL